MNRPFLSGRTTETMAAPHLVNFAEKSPFLSSYNPPSSFFATEPVAKQKTSVMKQTKTEILAIKMRSKASSWKLSECQRGLYIGISKLVRGRKLRLVLNRGIIAEVQMEGDGEI